MNPLLTALEANQRYRPQLSYRFKLTILGEPTFLPLLVREVSVGGGSLEVEEIQSGALRFGLPRNAEVSRMEVTIALDDEGKVFEYFRNWREQVLSRRGVFGIPYGPDGYVRTASVHMLDKDYQESKLIRKMEVFPESLGQMAFSAKNQEVMEMQVTLVQFMPSTENL